MPHASSRLKLKFISNAALKWFPVIPQKTQISGLVFYLVKQKSPFGNKIQLFIGNYIMNKSILLKTLSSLKNQIYCNLYGTHIWFRDLEHYTQQLSILLSNLFAEIRHFSQNVIILLKNEINMKVSVKGCQCPSAPYFPSVTHLAITRAY